MMEIFLLNSVIWHAYLKVYWTVYFNGTWNPNLRYRKFCDSVFLIYVQNFVITFIAVELLMTMEVRHYDSGSLTVWNRLQRWNHVGEFCHTQRYERWVYCWLTCDKNVNSKLCRVSNISVIYSNISVRLLSLYVNYCKLCFLTHSLLDLVRKVFC